MVKAGWSAKILISRDFTIANKGVLPFLFQDSTQSVYKHVIHSAIFIFFTVVSSIQSFFKTNIHLHEPHFLQ